VQKSTQVANSIIDKATTDYNFNDNNIKTIWSHYTKTLNISSPSKKGNFVSMIVDGKKGITNQNIYKSFLNEFN
jgi:hypothetical protein